MPEEEQLRFEDEYFAEGERFEHLEAAENDLVDSYVRGALSASDRRQFESYYLSSPRHRAGLSFATALADVSTKLEPHVAPNWSLQRLFRWAGSQELILACGFSVLLIAVTLLMFQNLRLRSDLKHVRAITSELQANQASLIEEIARLENRTASNPGSVQTAEIAKLEIPPLSHQTLLLTPETLRAAGQDTPTLFLIHASSVELQLVLDSGGDEAKTTQPESSQLTLRLSIYRSTIFQSCGVTVKSSFR